MDDEAASQQLMSEARGTPHVDDMDGPAIPLSLDGAGAGPGAGPGASQNSLSASLAPAKPKTKKSKRQQIAISQIPRTFRSSPPSLDELQAAAVGTPSKSQAYAPTAPPSQITGHSTKDTKRSQAAAGLDESCTQSSTIVEAASQSSQSNRKRRKKYKLRGQSSQNNPELETLAATQEMALPTATEDAGSRIGAPDEPALLPSDLLGKVHLDEPHALNPENAAGSTSTSQNGSKKKKKRVGKDKQAAASSTSNLTGLVRNAHDASTQPPPFENNSSSAVPSRKKKKKGRSENSEKEKTQHVLVADLLDIEQPTVGTHVRVADVLDAVDDGRADGERDPVVVRLPDAADRRDVGFFEYVLGEVYACQ